MPTHKKAVLVTGGSRRLGLLMARVSLELGYRVIIHYHASPSPAKKVLAAAIAAKQAFLIQADLQENPERIFDRIDPLPVRLEGLVNSASVFTEGNLNQPSHLESIVNVNVFSSVRLSQRFAEKIRHGWIINITDAHIGRPNANFQNYRISKLMLAEITRQQAFLYAPNIRVNAIAPGAMLPAAGKDARYFKSLAGEIPLGRTGDLASFADAFSFLVKNTYLTGETVHVDGGWNIVG